jgi:hypothetical protein
MIELKKNEHANALRREKRLRKEFGLNVGMLKGFFAETRKPEEK